MSENRILKIICSLPIILIALYFIKFLGIGLIILRCFVYRDKKLLQTSIILMLLGTIVFLPKLGEFIFDMMKMDSEYINQVVDAKIYPEFMNFGKYLLCLGVVLLIVTFIVRSATMKLKSHAVKHIMEYEKKQAEISKENDLKIKMQQEKAKNTRVVYCSNCGADNIVVGSHGKCKYCRTILK